MRETRKLKFVFFGLSLSSSWGNGHATTYRALIKELCELGHEVLFLERDLKWYSENRDFKISPWGDLQLYTSLAEVKSRYLEEVRSADAVIVGSYVTEGIELGRWVQKHARGVCAFYDIDTPITVAQLQAEECSYLDAATASGYDLYLSFSGGPILRKIEKEFGVERAVPLYCSVDPEVYSPDDSARLRWTLGYLGTYSQDRQEPLERLLLEPAQVSPRRQFVVAGPQYPEEIDWPQNVERIEHLAPTSHPEFYNQQWFTLNLTRKNMIISGFSPSVRLFEAAACGVPIISDSWPGIEEFFEPGREILIAQDGDDVLEFISSLSSRERNEIGHLGRKRVLEKHTARHRARELEQYIQEEASGGYFDESVSA